MRLLQNSNTARVLGLCHFWAVGPSRGRSEPAGANGLLSRSRAVYRASAPWLLSPSAAREKTHHQGPRGLFLGCVA
jgi:hypothetical protein